MKHKHYEINLLLLSEPHIHKGWHPDRFYEVYDANTGFFYQAVTLLSAEDAAKYSSDPRFAVTKTLTHWVYFAEGDRVNTYWQQKVNWFPPVQRERVKMAFAEWREDREGCHKRTKAKPDFLDNIISPPIAFRKYISTFQLKPKHIVLFVGNPDDMRRPQKLQAICDAETGNVFNAYWICSPEEVKQYINNPNFAVTNPINYFTRFSYGAKENTYWRTIEKFLSEPEKTLIQTAKAEWDRDRMACYAKTEAREDYIDLFLGN